LPQSGFPDVFPFSRAVLVTRLTDDFGRPGDPVQEEIHSVRSEPDSLSDAFFVEIHTGAGPQFFYSGTFCRRNHFGSIKKWNCLRIFTHVLSC
jgi:hypothetical protein